MFKYSFYIGDKKNEGNSLIFEVHVLAYAIVLCSTVTQHAGGQLNRRLFEPFKNGIRIINIQRRGLYIIFLEAVYNCGGKIKSNVPSVFGTLSQAPSAKVSGNRTGARACSEPSHKGRLLPPPNHACLGRSNGEPETRIHSGNWSWWAWPRGHTL